MLKLSPNKVTLPGAKQVWRNFAFDDDLLALRDEPAPAAYKPLLQPVMSGGRRISPPDTIDAALTRLLRDLEDLPIAALDLRAPSTPHVKVSDGLHMLARTTIAALHEDGSAQPYPDRNGHDDQF